MDRTDSATPCAVHGRPARIAEGRISTFPRLSDPQATTILSPAGRHLPYSENGLPSSLLLPPCSSRGGDRNLWSPNEGFPGGGKSPNTINVPPKARRRRRRRPARRRRSSARSPFTGPLGVPNWQHPGSAGSPRRIRGARILAQCQCGRGGPLSGTDKHQARQPAGCASDIQKATTAPRCWLHTSAV